MKTKKIKETLISTLKKTKAIKSNLRHIRPGDEIKIINVLKNEEFERRISKGKLQQKFKNKSTMELMERLVIGRDIIIEHGELTTEPDKRSARKIASGIWKEGCFKRYCKIKCVSYIILKDILINLLRKI